MFELKISDLDWSEELDTTSTARLSGGKRLTQPSIVDNEKRNKQPHSRLPLVIGFNVYGGSTDVSKPLLIIAEDVEGEALA